MAASRKVKEGDLLLMVDGKKASVFNARDLVEVLTGDPGNDIDAVLACQVLKTI